MLCCAVPVEEKDEKYLMAYLALAVPVQFDYCNWKPNADRAGLPTLTHEPVGREGHVSAPREIRLASVLKPTGSSTRPRRSAGRGRIGSDACCCCWPARQSGEGPGGRRGPSWNTPPPRFLVPESPRYYYGCPDAFPLAPYKGKARRYPSRAHQTSTTSSREIWNPAQISLPLPPPW